MQKLRTGNLQSERGRYDGTMVYAQHKVRPELDACDRLFWFNVLQGRPKRLEMNDKSIV